MTAVAPALAAGRASRLVSIVAPAAGVALLGSGLVVVAIGAGMGTWASAVLVTAGAGQLVVAVMTLAGHALARRAIATIAAIAPAACWAALVPIDHESVAAIPLLPMLAAFALATPAAVLPRLRGTARLREGAAAASVVVAAAVVALVVTPALAATPAGGLAVPHGEHGVVDEHSGH